MMTHLSKCGAAAVLLGCIIGCGDPSRAPAVAQAPASEILSQTDKMLLAAAKVALPPPGFSAVGLPDPHAAGAQLVGMYCAQCHDLPTPTMHSSVDWPSITRRMWLRMDGLQDLGIQAPTPAERFTMLGYLNANSLKLSGATLPPGPGREAFAMVCSRCHALPDPRAHSPGDWPIVYARMEQNMDRMHVSERANGQAGDILVYLQTAATSNSAANHGKVSRN